MRPCAHHGCPNPGTKKCAACESALYCSARCQRLAWPRHRPACATAALTHSAMQQATAAIQAATTAALTHSAADIAAVSEATEETGAFVFALTAEDEWSARRAYVEDRLSKMSVCVSVSEESERVELQRVLAVADAMDTPVEKLIALRSTVSVVIVGECESEDRTVEVRVNAAQEEETNE